MRAFVCPADHYEMPGLQVCAAGCRASRAQRVLNDVPGDCPVGEFADRPAAADILVEIGQALTHLLDGKLVVIL